MRKALFLSLALAGLSSAAFSAEIKLRVSGHFPAAHTASKGMALLNEELTRLTKGELRIDYFPDEQLGGSFEGVDQVRTGQIDIDLNGPEWYGRVVPELEVLNLPFLATSDKQAYCIMDTGLGQYLSGKMEQKDLIVLGWMANGIRHLTNNRRPINSLADMKGLKIRTPPSETYLETFRALGANATPLDIKELYQALQQGVVDGQENPYDNTFARKFFEVQKYLSNTGHFFSWASIVMNKKSYDRLSTEQKEILRKAVGHAVTSQREAAAADNKRALQSLIDKRMQYSELSPQVLAQFREAVKPIYEKAKVRAGEDAITRATKAATSCS